MVKKYFTYEDLTNHPFSKIIFEEGMKVKEEVFLDNSFLSTNPEYKRSPNEFEYYILGVGFTLSQLFTWLVELNNVIEFIANKTPSQRLKKKNITTYDLIIYHLENYIIRVQSIYDRVLFLVDAVFHLGNSPENIEHSIISENIYVKRSKVHNALKSLKKHLRTFVFTRNKIIHQEGFQEDDLRRLEFYCMFQGKVVLPASEKEIGKKEIDFIVKELSAKIVKDKLEQFSEFNQILFEKLFSLFTELEKEYVFYKKRLVKIIQ